MRIITFNNQEMQKIEKDDFFVFLGAENIPKDVGYYNGIFCDKADYINKIYNINKKQEQAIFTSLHKINKEPYSKHIQNKNKNVKESLYDNIFDVSKWKKLLIRLFEKNKLIEREKEPMIRYKVEYNSPLYDCAGVSFKQK